ncbi:hypothetical protein TELCIR_19068, partial [Teladorsagia circumcincta]
SDSPRISAEAKEMPKTDLTMKQASKSKKTEVIAASTSGGVLDATPAKANEESGIKAKKVETPKKTATSDFFDDILAGARCAPSQEKDTPEEVSTSAKDPGTSFDLVDDILAATSSNVGEADSTQSLADRSQLTDVEHELRPHSLHPSSSSESVEGKDTPSSAPVVRRTRKSSTGKHAATQVAIEGQQQEETISSKQSEEKPKKRGRPKKEIMPEAPGSTASEVKNPSGSILSPTLRTRANVLKEEATRNAPPKSPPSREPARTVAARKRRVEEVHAVESFPASQKPSKGAPSCQESDGKAVAKPPEDGPPCRVTRRSGPVAPKKRRMVEEISSKADAKAEKPAVVAKSSEQVDDKATEELTGDGPPSRVTRRTGPIAPRKRRIDEGSAVKETSEAAETIKRVCSSLEDTDDEEDRLCVADDEETVEAEQQPKAALDVRGGDEERPASDDDDEDRLVVDDDVEEPSVEGDGMKEVEETTAVEKPHDSGPEDNVRKSGHVQVEAGTSSVSEEGGESADEEALLKSPHSARKGAKEKTKKLEAVPVASTRSGASKTIS